MPITDNNDDMRTDPEEESTASLEDQPRLITIRPFSSDYVMKAPQLTRLKRYKHLDPTNPELFTRISTIFGRAVDIVEIFALIRLSHYSEKYSIEIADDRLYEICAKCVQSYGMDEPSSLKIRRKTINLVKQLTDHHLIKYIPQRHNYLVTGSAKKIGDAFLSAFDGSSIGFPIDDYTNIIIKIREKLQEWVAQFPDIMDMRQIDEFLAQFHNDKAIFIHSQILEAIIILGNELSDLFENLLNSIAVFRSKYIRAIHSDSDLGPYKIEIKREITKYRATIDTYTKNSEDINSFSVRSHENFEKIEDLCIALQSKISRLTRAIREARLRTSPSLDSLLNELESIDNTCEQTDGFVRNFDSNVNSIILGQVRNLRYLLTNLSQLLRDSVFTSRLYTIWQSLVFDPLEDPEKFKERPHLPRPPQLPIQVQNYEIEDVSLQEYAFDWDQENEYNQVRQRIAEVQRSLEQAREAAELESEREALRAEIMSRLFIYFELFFERLDHVVNIPQVVYDESKKIDIVKDHLDLFTSGLYLRVLSQLLNHIPPERLLLPEDLGMRECELVLQFCDTAIRVLGPRFISSR